ncbi:MAG TPA: type II toxin-antitoxin system VapC family toxin [Thermoanaerobaculia bacterium]|nr:type II toxin-antitoxin system VapC family toxin [Thermoanaerobaculia bacterium]
MKLLLDTHVWIWSRASKTRLTPRVARALANTSHELWLSPVSSWEIVLLAERGRLDLDIPASVWIARALATAPVREATLTHEVVLESCAFTLPHSDPADRFLIATARFYDLTLVTADERLIECGLVPVLPNR